MYCRGSSIQQIHACFAWLYPEAKVFETKKCFSTSRSRGWDRGKCWQKHRFNSSFYPTFINFHRSRLASQSPEISEDWWDLMNLFSPATLKMSAKGHGLGRKKTTQKSCRSNRHKEKELRLTEKTSRRRSRLRFSWTSVISKKGDQQKHDAVLVDPSSGTNTQTSEATAGKKMETNRMLSRKSTNIANIRFSSSYRATPFHCAMRLGLLSVLLLVHASESFLSNEESFLAGWCIFSVLVGLGSSRRFPRISIPYL